jgi:hypothetical protein
MNDLERHERDKYIRLEKRKRELIGELMDIESYMADLKDIGCDSTIYIGCHARERFEDGSPKFKAESVFKTSLPYAKAIKLLRGLNEIVKKIINFNIDDKKESWTWKDLLQN